MCVDKHFADDSVYDMRLFPTKQIENSVITYFIQFRKICKAKPLPEDIFDGS